MSYPVSRQEISTTVPASSNLRVPIQADFVFFHTVPTGVAVSLNDETESPSVEGEIHQGDPGSAPYRSVLFRNTSGSDATIRIIYGLGSFSVIGITRLVGSIPIPTGAATSALQTAGNASLAALALASTRTARGTVVINDTAAFNGKKSIAVANRATSTGNVTVTFADASTLVLEPGEGMSWAVPDRLDTLDNLSVTSPDATTFALVTSVA